MLIINNELVSELLTMEDCIRVQEEAFRKLPTGGAIHRPRIDMYFPCEREDGYFRWGTMEGANDGYFAIRMKSDIMTWPKDANGNWTEEKYCREPGTYCGVIFLLSTRNAEPLAFINDGVLQHMRVGGGAGIGVKYLAREDSHVVGMLGSGGMARTFLEAFKCVRDIRLCKVYSPTAAHREAFAQEMSQAAQHRGAAVDSPREAVRGADILSSCTDSMQPVYDADWIEKGMHVTNLGSSRDAGCGNGQIRPGGAAGNRRPADEADRALPGRARPLAGCLHRRHGRGDEAHPGEEPAARFRRRQPGFHGSRQGRRQARLRGSRHRQVQGRTSRDQVTFYRNVGNQGLQFSSVGGSVYAQAVKAGKGRDIPTEWFLQDIRD